MPRFGCNNRPGSNLHQLRNRLTNFFHVRSSGQRKGCAVGTSLEVTVFLLCSNQVKTSEGKIHQSLERNTFRDYVIAYVRYGGNDDAAFSDRAL